MAAFRERVPEYCAHLEKSWTIGCRLPTNPAALASGHALLGPGRGKRMRPLLVYATGEALGVSREQLHAPAAAWNHPRLFPHP